METTLALDPLLQQCELEELHRSGAIQSFGALIRVDTETGLITHVSANFTEFTGAALSALLGQPANAIPWFPIDALAALPKEPGKSLVPPGTIETPRQQLSGNLIRGDGFVLLELEPNGSHDRAIALQQYQSPLLSVPYHDLEVMAHHDLLLRAFYSIAGFDRIMIYRFHDDWSGEVIAEKCEPSLGCYFGLRFPAGDIPAIARNLYMINPARMIPDSREAAVGIVGIDASPPDLTWSDLRSVSPIHLQYLENMGVRASFSVPLRIAGRLWGLVACHHLTPKLLSRDQRNACVCLTNAYALGLTSHFASRRLQIFDSLERRIDGILELLSQSPDPLDGVEKSSDRLMDVMSAQGLALAIDNDVVIAGTGPDLDGMAVIDDWFLNDCKDNIVISDRLEDLFPGQIVVLVAASGMVAIKARSLRSGWVRFYWFRPAEPQEVAWAGNPNKPVVEDAGVVVLSPRRSFERWIEVTSGTSRPWSFEERMTAAKFRNTLLHWL
ncbi:MAG: GAF domain-containing protein [Rhodospirillaceae bacterium]